MRLLVCGSREYDDWARLQRVLFEIRKEHRIDVLIHGGARGADEMAGQFADFYQIPVEVYPADWNRYGKRAGYVRNQQMLDEGRPDYVVAFYAPQPAGNRGTSMMVDIARKAGVQVLEILPRGY